MRFTRVGAFTAVMTTTLCVLIFTSCKADKTTPCGDQTCRSGYTCDTIHDECVIPAQLEACVGEADGAECSINGTYGYVCDQEVCLQSECGDGILDVHTGEQCDDGNHVDDDECPNNCTLSCGDGTVNPGEDCDGNDLAGETCSTRGYDTGQLTCELNCSFDESNCSIDCGNGVIHSNEGCDDDNTDPSDGCSETCEVEGGWDCQGEPSVCEPIPHDALYGGGGHVCAHRVDGTTWCWGGNSNGQLADGTEATRFVPTQMTPLSGIVDMGLGGWHTCALVSDGTVWCWGGNGHGQLGDGNTADSSVAVQVVGLSDVTDIAVGGVHSCAVKSDGTVWCWGRNTQGQLGNNDTTADGVPNPTPVQVIGVTDAVVVGAGAEHTCIIKSNDTVWCWGWNNHGQSGQFFIPNNPTPPPITTAMQVTSIPDAVDIKGGFGHTCALRSDDSVWCWGWNVFGQLGDTDLASTQVAAAVNVTNTVAFATGFAHTCAVRSDGTIRCWGWNYRGQLGNGTVSGELEANPDPIEVPGITDAALIATKGEYTCITRADGTVWCWGRNEDGQLGNDGGLDSTVPVPIAMR